jgi:putative SOS response-associated peptidase YedK
MCGRYAQTTSQAALSALLGASATADFTPRYNISPTQTAPVVLSEGGERRLDLFRWGMVPSFAADEKALPLMFNARAETLAQKPSFRAALQRRRCLAPADGWYEWKALGRFKQPYLIRRVDRAPFMFAALWDVWRRPDGSTMRSFTIVTVSANPELAPIHDRMPAVLPPEAWEAWLDTRVDGRSLALRGLHPTPIGAFVATPVSARINQAANDGPEVQEPAPDLPTSQRDEPVQPRLI